MSAAFIWPEGDSASTNSNSVAQSDSLSRRTSEAGPGQDKANSLPRPPGTANQHRQTKVCQGNNLPSSGKALFLVLSVTLTQTHRSYIDDDYPLTGLWGRGDMPTCMVTTMGIMDTRQTPCSCDGPGVTAFSNQSIILE